MENSEECVLGFLFHMNLLARVYKVTNSDFFMKKIFRHNRRTLLENRCTQLVSTICPEIMFVSDGEPEPQFDLLIKGCDISQTTMALLLICDTIKPVKIVEDPNDNQYMQCPQFATRKRVMENLMKVFSHNTFHENVCASNCLSLAMVNVYEKLRKLIEDGADTSGGYEDPMPGAIDNRTVCNWFIAVAMTFSSAMICGSESSDRIINVGNISREHMMHSGYIFDGTRKLSPVLVNHEKLGLTEFAVSKVFGIGSVKFHEPLEFTKVRHTMSKIPPVFINKSETLMFLDDVVQVVYNENLDFCIDEFPNCFDKNLRPSGVAGSLVQAVIGLMGSWRTHGIVGDLFNEEMKGFDDTYEKILKVTRRIAKGETCCQSNCGFKCGLKS